MSLDPSKLWSDLRLPLMQAPMFISSSLDLVKASCRAGVIGAFPVANPRAPETLDSWLAAIREEETRARDGGGIFAPFCVNLLASSNIPADLRRQRIETCRKAKVPLVLTGLGDPTEEVKAVHDWGGIVFHDVTTVRYAEKAIAAGVDGLMLVTGGAGGHAGTLNPFSFLPRVRRMFDGVIMLAGGVADGTGIAAALTLGADLVVMGTRFIATRESGTFDPHKQMLVESEAEDVLFTDAIAGLPASFLKPSMVMAGLDPANLPPPTSRHRPDLPKHIKPWKTIWSGGHSTALIDDVPPVAELVDRLAEEFDAAPLATDWRARLESRTA
ncbi:MAG: nitronate monooxygenase [Novosphingobium sp.]|nr:nitronate monooxygenase [Novosphingobium sp.]